MDIKPNEAVEDFSTPLIDRPIDPEKLGITSPELVAPLVAKNYVPVRVQQGLTRQSTKKKKRSVKFKKKKAAVKEDPDALTIFECNKCKYKCTNRENFKHHEDFMHSSSTSQRLTEFTAISTYNGSY